MTGIASSRVDRKVRQKLQDERRMRFRRAIEARQEDQRLALELDDRLDLMPRPDARGRSLH